MKILATTGIRSEYYILRPAIKELAKRGHDVKLILSGAHLSDWHGSNLKKIENDGFQISDRIDSLFSTDRKLNALKVLALWLPVYLNVLKEKIQIYYYMLETEKRVLQLL